jgi:hypothetical protein
MIFKKTIPNIAKKKCRLLYLMGMTWHTQCMFDLDCAEPSFCDILNEHGIETYTFNNSQINHLDNINQARQLIEEYQIDYIFAYSYGCRVVADLLETVNVKGVMLLDPSSEVQVKKEKIDTGFIVRKSDIDSILTANSVETTAVMRAAHIAAVSDTDTLFIPNYIDRVIKNTLPLHERDLPQLFERPVRLFLTRQSPAKIRQWRPNVTTFYPNSSHWIMIEPSRYRLAQDVHNFISC